MPFSGNYPGDILPIDLKTPREKTTSVRFDIYEQEMIAQMCEHYGYSQTELLRRMVRKFYENSNTNY